MRFSGTPFPALLCVGSHLQAARRPTKSAGVAERPHRRVVACARGRGVGLTSGALRPLCPSSFVGKRTSHQRHEQEGCSRRADLLRCRIRRLAKAMLAFSADAARAVPRACPTTRGNLSTLPSVQADDEARGWACSSSRLQLARCRPNKTRASLRFSSQTRYAGHYSALRTSEARVQKTAIVLLDHPQLGTWPLTT